MWSDLVAQGQAQAQAQVAVDAAADFRQRFGLDAR
jgi:hypothetical protein